jgi:hypothetical protein
VQARKQQRRVVAILLAVVSAAGLAVGAFGDRWLATPHGDNISVRAGDISMTTAPGSERSAGIGLRAYERCYGSCSSISNFELVDVLEKRIEQIKEENKGLPLREQVALPRYPWHGFPVVGIMTFITALIAAAGLLAGAVLALARRRVDMAIMPTTIAVLGLTVSIITGCIFVATKPDFAETLVVGWSFITFGIAAVLGLAAVFPLNRAIRPIDVELGEASATMSWGSSRDDQP